MVVSDDDGDNSGSGDYDDDDNFDCEKLKNTALLWWEEATAKQHNFLAFHIKHKQQRNSYNVKLGKMSLSIL